MTIIELLAALRSNDIHVWVEGETLRYSAPSGTLTPALRAELVQHKADLLTMLHQTREDVNGKLPSLRPVSQAGELPLSFAQQRMWFLAQLQAEAGAMYSINAALRLAGQLDQAALRTALLQLTQRQMSLRMNFRDVGGQPVISLRASYDPLTVEDLRALTVEDQEAAVRRFADEHARRPFDLEHDPLLRVTLLELGEGAQVLLFSIHHIIADGWSLGVLVRELSALYGAAYEGHEAELPSLLIQYPDYAAWQREWLRGEVLERQLAYWREQLAGAPSLLKLPTDFPRPAAKTYCGAQWTQSLEPKLMARLQRLSRSHGATLYMTLLAAFKTLLYRYSGETDLLVGSSIANRTQSQTEPLIGFFVNTLVLRSRLAPEQSFSELLASVRQTALAAYAHQDLPFELLVGELQPERSLGHGPLFQVMFALQNAPLKAVQLAGVHARLLNQDTGTAKFDLLLNLAEHNGVMEGEWEYSTDLFEPETVKRMAQHYEVLLRAIVEDPDQHLSDLPLLTAEERQQLLVEWNETKAEYPMNQCIHELFEKQVERTPDAMALVFEQEEVSYRELDRRANQLAHYLCRLGVGPEALVAVCMERSVEMVVALLGVLKAGGAYVPLDPTYPRERLAFMLEDSGASVLLTERQLADGLAGCKARLLCLDAEWQEVGRESRERLGRAGAPENLVYVIYTSGSTGRPKGVMITQRGLVNYLSWCTTAYRVCEGEGSPVHSPLGFDLTVTSLFPPLLAGQRVVLVPEEGVEALEAAFSSGTDFSLVKITPAHLEVLSERVPAQEVSGWTRAMIIGGEALSKEQIAFWRAHAPETRLINEYGPTETVVGCCVYQVPHGTNTSGSIPIGRPIANTQLYVLDRHMQPVPIGVPGELYIGGAGLARGYVNHPELAAERFMPNPFTEEPGSRLYKTGDLARYLPDGNLEFLGRLDHQVKVRGFRVELGEIEMVLREHPAVREALVLADADARLVAYVVPSSPDHGSESRASRSAWEAEQVSSWQTVFDDYASRPSPHQDPTFNITGWDSSYNSWPIPEAEMREWVDSTVERILDLHPDRVLEIGCGTGLLMFRVAPHCTQYWATDFSQEALHYVRQQLTRPELELPQVALFQRKADDFAGIEPEAFDAVFLNSVVQYFPSIEYLLRVLEGAVNAVEPGGFIFVGDVRSFPLLEAFHSSVQLYQAPSSLPTSELQQRVKTCMLEENELVIDPSFFTALRQYLPKVGRVQILLKHGRHHNELTRFRYDVILHRGPEIDPMIDHPWLDWQAQGLTLPAVRRLLAETEPKMLGIAGVPNARLLAEVKTLEWLSTLERHATVGELREALQEVDREMGVEPEDVWALGQSLPYAIDVSWSGSGVDGRYNIVLRRCTTARAQVSTRSGAAFPQETVPLKPWRDYANQPLQGMVTRTLVAQLRSFLQEKLPDYMVPSAFVLLDTLPLTPNGKVDRQALPTPRPTRSMLEASFVAPRRPAEQTLAEIWAAVLGHERVGIHDNFFELGGDSILSIQILSRARQAGLHLTLKQLFQFQTVAGLAEVAEPEAGHETEQGPVTGPVPLTPIQHWFFQQRSPEPHHFNQAVMLELRRPLDGALLEQALWNLLEHHDALRLRFLEKEGVWRQYYAQREREQVLWRADMSQMDEGQQAEAIELAAARAQSSLSLSEGPLLRGVLIERGAGRSGRLLLVIHHLAVDGVSWRVLLEDLERAYGQLERGQRVRLPARTSSFKRWAEQLEQYAASAELERELAYWLDLQREPVPELPVDHPGGANAHAAEREVAVGLSEPETRALLQQVLAVYNAQINDMLLTALAEAVRAWTGQEQLLVSLEGHGREPLFEEVDLTRTVGWFTSIFPVVLDLRGRGQAGEALKAVKEQLRAIPRRGIGYGVLRYIAGERARAALGGLQVPQVSFNYLGQLDQVLSEGASFRLTGESVGPRRSARAERAHELSINAQVLGGRLQLTWSYSAGLHERATVERLAGVYMEALRQLITHCQSPQAGGYTPSDFPLAGLDQLTLDRLVGQVCGPAPELERKNVEAIYPLSPMQEGMLFHTLYAPESGQYVEQSWIKLHGKLDGAAFERAWQQVVDRYAVLRTGFAWQGLERPLQVVRRKARLPFEYDDWSGLGEGAQAARLQRELEQERARGFELERAPLMRVKVARLVEGEHQVLWSFHHAILDGWSATLLVREVFAIYKGLVRGTPAELEPTGAYQDFIAWLQRQDLGKAEAYWREVLAGITAPTPLAIDRSPGDVGDTYSTRLELGEEATAALRRFVRQQRLTIDLLVQGAWALLLARYSRERDVVFGATVSGRPVELAGVERMVGLLINTVPVRVRADEERSVIEWLERLQEQQVEMRQYEYSSLVDIQRWSEVPHGVPLFESILVFENYPLSGRWFELSAGLEVRDKGYYGRTNFPLAIIVNPGERLVLKASYDSGRFEGKTIERMLSHLQRLLEGIVADPKQRLGELPSLSEGERRQLFTEWNNTTTDYPRDKCIQQLFEEQVERTPDAIAVIYGAEQFTYAELNGRANQLAHHLRRLGVGPEVLVGVYVERSLEMVVGLLGIIKAGGAYVPLDPTYPPERLSFMMEDTQTPLLLTQERLVERLPAHAAVVICLDRDWEKISQENFINPIRQARAENLAYVIYTSGSTGRPKGVCVPHYAISRLVRATNYVSIGPGDRIGQAATLAFDAATFEVWGALLNGAVVQLLSREEVLDPDCLARQVREGRFNILFLTTALFNRLAQMDAAMFQSLDYLLFGGEAVDPRWVAAVLESGRPRHLLHVYGPTESTTFATWHEVEEVVGGAVTVPIGRPISNTRVYLLDEHWQAVPIGVPGELYIGGDGLARGYLNRPEATAERFVEVEGLGHLYRTGDLCRWRGDGAIEFLGRLDHQVKLRGFRIEPGEIEALLRREPEVKEAVVVAQGEGEHRQLVAYLLAGEGAAADVTAIRQSLRRQLPEYMVPGQFLILDELPLTANGKVDRGRLSAPPQAPTPQSGPMSLSEELLAGLWCEVLKREAVRPEDNFFELGGHSLMAMQVLSRIRTVFHSQLPLAAVFTSPTLRDMAAQIEADRSAKIFDTAIVRIDREHPLPLSFAQERLWFLSQLEPENPFYNTPLALRIRGQLNKIALAGALQDILNRHEVLRTAFVNDGGQPHQVLLDELTLALAEEDLSHLPTAELEARLLERASVEARTPFYDLAAPPLVRATLLKLRTDEHALLLTMHHIVTDGWSLSILTRELSHFYNARCAGGCAELEPLPVQYADFAAWQRQWLSGELLDRQLEYWRRHLSGAPPMLALPADHPRPAVQQFRGGSIRFTVDGATRDALQRIGRAHNATLFMTLLSGFAVLLYRYSGQSDIVIGSPIANRQRPELEGLLGFFVNTLALRIDLAGQPRFADLLDRVQRLTLEAYAHQDLPFEKLVDDLQPERDLSRSPLFQVMFALQNMPAEMANISGLHLSPIHVQRSAALFDLVLDFWDTEDGLHGVLEYNRDLFEEGTAERLARHLQNLLRALAADAEVVIDAVSFLDRPEAQQLLAFSNGLAVEYPVRRSFAEAFEQQVLLTPDRVAAVADGQTISYAALNQRANRIAHKLHELGVRANTPVGVLVPRGIGYLAAVLGTIKSGGAFLPLDPAYPVERLRYMIADSGCCVLLSNAAGARKLSGERLPRNVRDVVLISESHVDPVVFAGDARVHTEPNSAQCSTANPPIANHHRDILYVLYTSGSTGLPKGALVRHDGALNHIFAEFRLLEFHPVTSFLQSAPASSDISVWQCLAPLLIGGRTVFADFETVCRPAALFELIQDKRVTLIELVPVVLEGLISHAAGLPEAERALPHLEWAMVTGEAASVALVNRWFRIWPHIPLVNAYGPTEAADDICQHVMRAPLEPHRTTVPIGSPIDNLSVMLLDNRQQLVPIGVPGEICVSGIGVGAGYWRQSNRTAAAFMPNRHRASTYGDTIYRTGDLGRWRADSSLEFLGRLDHQVKIRGFRVELGEIEAVLTQHPQVHEAVVLDYQEERGERQLAAYVQVDVDAAATSDVTQEQVDLWKSLHEDSYSDDSGPAKRRTFNTIGWDSTYTGEPLSSAEMRECVANAVVRIRQLQPRHLLEIGCGTGLLLFRLVSRGVEYCGADLSEAAIRQLKASQRQLAIPGFERAQFLHQEAGDFSPFSPRSFDTIVLNSVIQYFPSVDYLLTVLRNAAATCTDGGAIFIGDVRSLPLLRSYHLSVQVFKTEDSVTKSELEARIDAQLSREQELAVDPRLFEALCHRLPRASTVLLRPKRGRLHNEMTRFRYDVVLRVGSPLDTSPFPPDSYEDWRQTPYDAAAMRGYLESARPLYWGLRRVANARLEREQRMLEWLRQAAPTATVRELRHWLTDGPAGPALDPEAVWHLAKDLPYRVEVVVEPDSVSGEFAVLFTHRDSPHAHVDLNADRADVALRPWTEYANNPLQEKLGRRMVPQLREYLRGSLPGHMMPSTFTLLDRFPILPNGKIDRGALPKPSSESARSTDHTAPRTPTEAAVQAVWTAVLGIDDPGVHDNFFALGGHSLKATQLISRLQQQNKQLSLRDVFNYPTIAELAALLDRQHSTGALQKIPRTPSAERYPPSPAQRRLWVLAQMGGSAAYNMVDSLRVRGPLDLGSLSRAFTTLLRRHEILRTAFIEEDGELWQTVSSEVPDALQIVDLSGYDDPVSAARGFALDHASTIHDLYRTPLVRAAVLRLDAADHVLLFNMHHIISDGWSLDVLIREFMTLYGAAVSGNPDPLPPLEIQYRDYVPWQHERWLANAATAHDYWMERLRDVPPALELPTDYPRPPIKTYAGGRCHVTLSKATGEQLRRLARQQDVTLSMLLTALVKVLLYRYSGQPDIAVGCPVAGRTHPDLEHQIGLYVNTLVLRDQLAGAQPFAEFLRHVWETVMGALAHQEYPFDQVVHDVNPPRDPSRNPLFDVMVALQNTANVSLRLPDLEISSLGLDYGVTQFDLLWNFIDAPEGLQLELQYNSDLFRRETIEAMIHHWQTLAASVIADPATPLGRLPLLEPAERSALIEVPASRPQAPAYRSLVEWLEAQVARAPTAIAVTDGERHLTYAEFNARANQAAREIRGRLSAIGVVGEPLVGICMHRSVEQVIGVLGILKAGAAYVPLDPDAPVARLRYILQDAGVSLLVTDGRTADLHATHEYELTADEKVTADDSQNLDVAVDTSAAAYVIYTSGSTGAPKGAVITHGNVLRLFASTAHWFRFSSADVWTLFHSYAFDFSVWEIWGALLYGGRLVIVSYAVSRDPDQFYQLLSHEGVTVLNQTPSAFRQLMQAEAVRQEPLPLSLRYIIFGGEALQPSQLQPWFARHGDQRPQLVNMYGITETTVHVTYRPLHAGDAQQTASLIGVPIPDLSLYVLDEYGEPVPLGVPGELYVGGAGLARGYLFREQLTAERFIRDPFRPGERLYRTGDRVRRRRGGELEYLGRLDSQIKIRGHRIEAGEITAVLSLHPAVREAVVSVRQHRDDTYLLAYYVPSDGMVSEADLRRHLQEHLPAYMIPQAITPLPRLPLTVNGKLDERALPDPQPASTSATNGQSRAPRDGLERQILELWRRLLAHEGLGPDDNVFEHGAHSVLAVQARNHLQGLLGREVPVVLLFQYPTPAALTTRLGHGDAPEDDTMTARQRASQRRAASQQARQRRESREIT